LISPIAALVLAAGKSERMGGSPKALLKIKGLTFLELVLQAIADAGISNAAVVVGRHRDQIAAAFPERPLVFNPDYKKGMSTSVQAGIRSLPSDVAGAGVFLVDQPLIDAATIQALASELLPSTIVLPVHEGRRGHPVLFSAEVFAEILALPPEQGLNVVVRRTPGRIIEVAVRNKGVLEDIDTPEQFEKLLKESE
jgi:molybdenum cofactor cytidylyltransferase